MPTLPSTGGPSTPDSPRPETKNHVVRSGTFPVAEPRSGPFEEAPVASIERQPPDVERRALRRFRDDVVASLVHDLQGPLSAMMMDLDFAIDELPEDGRSTQVREVRGALQESRAAGAKLFRVIANLLDIARSDGGRLSPKHTTIDAATLLARVVAASLTDATALEVTLKAESALDAPFEGDHEMLARALGALVDCALRHATARGTITLGARRGPSGVILTVTSDGRPLSSELEAVMFDDDASSASPQVRSRGLGLYFCRRATEAHGGRLELVRATDASTCFRIEIPGR